MKTVAIVVLAVALAASLVLHLSQAIGEGALISHAGQTIKDLERERDALRVLALGLSAGKGGRVSYAEATKGSPSSEENGWLVAGPLAAKFDGDRLEAVCGLVWFDESDPCSKALN